MFSHVNDTIVIQGTSFPYNWWITQESSYKLPEIPGAKTIIGRKYIPGEIHLVTDGITQFDGGLNREKKWPEGDRYISKLNHYVSEYNKFLNPPLSVDELRKKVSRTVENEADNRLRQKLAIDTVAGTIKVPISNNIRIMLDDIVSQVGKLEAEGKLPITVVIGDEPVTISNKQVVELIRSAIIAERVRLLEAYAEILESVKSMAQKDLEIFNPANDSHWKKKKSGK